MYRSNEALLVRVVTQCPPDLADQHVEVAFDDEDVRPDLTEQVGFRHDVRALLDKRTQHRKRLWRQVDRLATAGQLPRL